MVLLKRFIISLVLLLSLTLDTYCAAPESLPVPPQTTVRLASGCSVEDVMKHELQKYEKDPSLTTFETAKGSMSAELVIMSPHYVARMSTSPHHAVEVDQFDIVIRTAKVDHYSLQNIGFKVCLPLEVILVADESNPLKKKTASSIVIMERAQGHPIAKYISSRLTDDAKSKMLFDLGKSLASFQMAFMRKIEGEYDTAAHGDFHSGNIFGLSESRSYRPSANWSFSLIDCAGLTFRGIHPLMDPLYFMYRTGYSLFRDGNSTRSLFNLTKSFYTGYLGHLPPDINRTLQILPDWRKVASTELTKTKNLVFLSSDPSSAAFLSRFDPLHAEAVQSVFTDLGYDLVLPKSFTGQSPAALTPCCLGAAVATPRAPTPAVVILPQDDCPMCAPKPAVLQKKDKGEKRGTLRRLISHIL